MTIKKYIPIGGIVLQDMGAWSSTVNYAIGHLVTLSGIAYRCTAPNLNQTPPNASYWAAYTNLVNSIIAGTWGAAPPNSTGNNGDLAIDTSTTPPTMYGPKAAGTWPTPGLSLGSQGPQGNPGAGYTNIVYDEVPSGTKNGSNKTFTLAHAPANNKGQLFFGSAGGCVALLLGTDYTISGTTLTYTTIAPNAAKGEIHWINYNY